MTKLKQLPVARYKDWAQLVVGNEALVPTNCNKYVRYVNLDNAASTPAFKQVKVAVFEFLNWYSNIHRGEGYKSRYSTAMYEKSREEVTRFLGLNTGTNTVIFVKNTTEAINKLANSLSFSDRDIVISTFMEHHSNALVAARLSREAGIGVRNGCFCAHPYVLSLLNIPREEQKKFQEQIRNGNKQDIPGLVRVSFGLYNTTAEIDYLIESLNYVLRTPYKNDNYVQDGVILYEN